MQYKENYGAHSWDGKGECPQYWKFKGGFDYISRELSLEEAQDGIEDFAQSVINSISYKDDYSEEYCADWELVTVQEYEQEQRRREREYNSYGCGSYTWAKKASERADQLDEWKEEKKAS
jgi:hypothetical protein